MDIGEHVVRHVDWIRRQARFYYTNEEDADDLASETIYKCLNQGRLFDPGRNFKPWIVAIMSNTYITQYNRRRCVMFTRIDDDDYDIYAARDRADERASLESIVSVIRKCARKSCCIECVLLYAKGFSYDEIAKMVDIPTGTVKSRIAAGRKILHEALY